MIIKGVDKNIKSWDDIIDPKNKDEIFDYWNKIGFLENLEDKFKKTLSYWFEYTVLLCKQEKVSSDVEKLIFPLIRRIYNGLIYKNRFQTDIEEDEVLIKRKKYFIYNQRFIQKIFLDIENLYKYTIPSMMKVYNSYYFDPDFDAEAEACASYADVRITEIDFFSKKIDLYLNDKLGEYDKLYKPIDRITKIRNITDEYINFFEDFPI